MQAKKLKTRLLLVITATTILLPGCISKNAFDPLINKTNTVKESTIKNLKRDIWVNEFENSWQGQVQDIDPNTTITQPIHFKFNEINRSGTTDNKGNFRITNLHPGLYFVEIKSDGYYTEYYKVLIQEKHHQIDTIKLTRIPL